MFHLLVYDRGRLTNTHRAMLEEGLPGTEILFRGDAVTDAELAAADAVFGNLPPELLPRCENLKLLQLTSAGCDRYLASMPEGVALANATGGYGLAISEHLMAMLLHLKKKLHLYSANQREHLWRDEGTVTSIHGSVVLIVGLGDIGGEFARRIHAFGGYTVGVRRAGSAKPDFLDELHTAEHLDKLIPRADVVALCLPGTVQTRGILSRERIGRMKPGAILLNVGRGAAVDQEALVEALHSGAVGGAGLDVTDPEPLPPEHPLWSAPNTILTPHISGGAHLPETYNRIVGIAVDNVRRLQAGMPLRNVVDLSTGYRSL